MPPGVSRGEVREPGRRRVVRVMCTLLLLSLGALGGSATSSARPMRSEAVAQASAEPTKAMITLLFGRTQWVSTDLKCVPLAGSVPLDAVAAAMGERGISGTGNVVVARTQESTRECYNRYVHHPSWADLAMLRDTYGWSFVSAGATYTYLTTLTPEQQYTESCGSLQAFADHGHLGAWGLFVAYPNNKYTFTIQRDVVSSCFAFGRRYHSGTVTRTVATRSPNWQHTVSVNGGQCVDSALPCYTAPANPPRRYMLPADLLSRVSTAPDTWTTLQFYRFAQGVKTGSGPKWNCEGPVESHWTSQPEVYCFNDYLALLDGLPRDLIDVRSPAEVATTWGVT